MGSVAGVPDGLGADRDFRAALFGRVIRIRGEFTAVQIDVHELVVFAYRDKQLILRR